MSVAINLEVGALLVNHCRLITLTSWRIYIYSDLNCMSTSSSVCKPQILEIITGLISSLNQFHII